MFGVQRFGVAASLLVTAGCATPHGSPPEAKLPEPLYIYFECRGTSRQISDEVPEFGQLALQAAIREDGQLLNRSVYISTGLHARNITAPDDADPGEFRLSVSLAWPGLSDWASYEQDRTNDFDWSRGAASFSYSPENPLSWDQKFRKKWPWRQVILDRTGPEAKGAVLWRNAEEQFGADFLLIHSDLVLTRDPVTASSGGAFSINIDRLLAFAAEAPALTIYDVAVSRAPRESNTYSPIGARKVIAAFQPDLRPIAAAVPRIRAEADPWLQSRLTDYKTSCERREFRPGDDEIIVTGESAAK